MAIESCTLIIKFKTNKTDSELLRALKLYSKETHKIGGENMSYLDALVGSDFVYITSIDDFVIIVGVPLVLDYVYRNQYSAEFPDSEFFFMFNESVSMLNGFVYGKGETIYRRKYVQDGAYFKAYDISPDLGGPLLEEKEYFKFNVQGGIQEEHQKDYMYGVYDYDISQKFLHANFFENPIEFLEKLTFNRNVNLELGEYISNSNEKVSTSDINKLFLGEVKKIMKECKFKKINFKGSNEKISKDSFYRQFEGFKVYLLVDKLLTFLPSKYVVSIDLEADWLNGNLEEGNYGLPIFSIDPVLYVKINEKGNDYIYTRGDLELAFNSFIMELSRFKEFFASLESNKLKEVFSNEVLYKYILNKIDSSARILSKITCRNEINFCLLYYFYSKDIMRSSELIDVLDLYLDDSSKNQFFQVVPRKVIANLYKAFK